MVMVVVVLLLVELVELVVQVGCSFFFSPNTELLIFKVSLFQS